MGTKKRGAKKDDAPGLAPGLTQADRAPEAAAKNQELGAVVIPTLGYMVRRVMGWAAPLLLAGK